MSTQPEPLRLAELLERLADEGPNWQVLESAAEELRRLREKNQKLLDALKKESEACAQICDQAAANYFPEMREAATAAKHCATVIRARAGDTA